MALQGLFVYNTHYFPRFFSSVLYNNTHGIFLKLYLLHASTVIICV